MLNTEKKTKVIIGMFALVMAIFYGISASMLLDWSRWIMPIIGLFLGAIILSENGVMMWFNASRYKSINVKEILGIISLVIGGGIILHSIFLLPPITGSIPASLLERLGVFGIIGSIGASILAVFHMFT